jgi:hypothetical protein
MIAHRPDPTLAIHRTGAGARGQGSEPARAAQGRRVKSAGISNKPAFAGVSTCTFPRSVRNVNPGGELAAGSGVAAVPGAPFMEMAEYSERFCAGGTGPDLWAENVGRQPPDATKFDGSCG